MYGEDEIDFARLIKNASAFLNLRIYFTTKVTRILVGD